MLTKVLTYLEEQDLLDRGSGDEAETMRTQRNIRNTLKYRLKQAYGLDKEQAEEIADKILRIHGLSKDSLDIVNIMSKFVKARYAQDVSVDVNANKESNTITSLVGESVIPYQKILGYDMLYRHMREDWGKKEAKTLSALMYDYSLAIHDSGKLMVPYCWAFDASKIVFFGRPFGQVQSKPPKRVSSYISALDETIHQMAGSHLVGAIAISTFFSDIAYVLINREHVSLETLRTDEKIRKYVENCVQTFIYSVNHLSRSSNESPFTNVSVFDRPKLKALFSEENMGWIFHTEEGEIDPEYFYDVIEECQSIFMDLFDKGDPLAGGMPFRFPVVTLNISKTKEGEVDPNSESFLDKISQREIYRYNIFTSLGTKVASCCFSGEEFITYKSRDGFHTCKLSDYVNSNLPEGETERHLLGDELINTPEGFKPITGVRKIPNPQGKLIDIEFENEQKISATPNQLFLLRRNGEELLVKAEDLIDNFSEFEIDVKILSVKARKSHKPVYDLEVSNDSHIFYIGEVPVHNCRLINNADLNELGASVNSFGGSALSMGSHRVVLLNTNRFALETRDDSKETFFSLLEERLNQATEILVSHRHLLKKLADNGFLMFLKNGWMDLDRMFSTIGLIGLIETIETFNKNKTSEEEKIDMQDLLVFINTKVNELSAKFKIPMNIEQVPGESMAERLVKTDKMLFGEELVPHKLYSNQFIPLWVDATIFERMEADGLYNQLFTGGGIVHFNLGEKTTPQQNKELIKFAVKSGCEHFALNALYSKCEKGHMSFGDIEKCPVCGAKIVDHMTRVVGFFTSVEKWNKTRREWEFPRRKFRAVPSLEEIKKEEDK